MKNLMKTAIAAAVTGMLVSPLAALANDAEDELEVDAVILPLDLDAAATPLNFGSLWVPGAGGTVTINPETGGRTVAGGSLVAGADEGEAGVFTLENGVPDTEVNYEFVGGLTVTLTGDGDPMDADLTLHLEEGTALSENVDGTGSFTLDEDGEAILNVGGTLTVGANQMPGAYQGTVNVTFNY